METGGELYFSPLATFGDFGLKGRDCSISNPGYDSSASLEAPIPYKGFWGWLASCSGPTDPDVELITARALTDSGVRTTSSPVMILLIREIADLPVSAAFGRESSLAFLVIKLADNRLVKLESSHNL